MNIGKSTSSWAWLRIVILLSIGAVLLFIGWILWVSAHECDVSSLSAYIYFTGAMLCVMPGIACSAAGWIFFLSYLAGSPRLS